MVSGRHRLGAVRSGAWIPLVLFAGAMGALGAAAGATAAPDLTVSLSAPTGALDLDTVPINITLSNGGTTASPNATVELAIDGTPVDPPLDFPPVAAGGALTRTASFVLSCGSHDLGATADPLNNVAETNESNNLGTGRASVVPVASFTATVTDWAEGHNLSLDASASHGCRPLAFSWVVTGGGTAAGEAVSMFVPAGNVTVALRATSLADATLFGTSSKVVTVRNIPPTVEVRFPVSPLPSGVRTSLFVEAVDVDGEVVAYAIDMGDGNHASTLSAAAAHAYAKAGTYEVEVVVTDNLGSNGSTTASIVVLNRPPLAVVSLPYFSGEQSQAVVLDALNSSDPEGGGLTYEWNFGDGTTASGPLANHTYAAPAVYVVRLTVRDEEGGTSTASVQVTVLPPRAGGGGGPNFLLAALVVFVAVAAVFYVLTQRRLSQQPGAQAGKKVPGGRDPAAGQPRSEEE